ncbi:MAG: cytochrome c3 family protein [Gemmatimonadota bacterium]|nr:MAG: cytochrome c3 family protein [Gemmatimonadota bacterium]
MGRQRVGIAAFIWLVGLTGAAGGAQAQENNCVTCHSALGGRLAAPVEAFQRDIHAEKGFGCVACHGGDASIAGMGGMARELGFVGRPRGRQVLDVCGRCHSDADFMRRYNPSLRVDQVTEYATSVHGRRLLELGDTAVATCLSCHPAHNVRPPSDPLSSVHPVNVAATCAACHGDADHMKPYGIPTDQREKYERSVHWAALSEQGDLSAPTCNDCHGNHGATPPGISWVGNVCGQCHSVMADYYEESRHATTFTMLGVPGCATCHQNHEVTRPADDMLGLDEGAVCARCHAPGDRGGETALAMRSMIDSLQAAYHAADSLLGAAENHGMEVSQALFELGGANDALVTARAAVHSFDREIVGAEVTDGLEVAVRAFARGEDAMNELRFRRTGLAVSVVIILALIAGLLLKIREVDYRATVTET